MHQISTKKIWPAGRTSEDLCVLIENNKLIIICLLFGKLNLTKLHGVIYHQWANFISALVSLLSSLLLFTPSLPGFYRMKCVSLLVNVLDLSYVSLIPTFSSSTPSLTCLSLHQSKLDSELPYIINFVE